MFWARMEKIRFANISEMSFEPLGGEETVLKPPEASKVLLGTKEAVRRSSLSIYAIIGALSSGPP